MGKQNIRKRVLVTGGAGYVGSHACKALARAGYLPVVFDNLSRGHAWAVKWGPLERGDLLNAHRIESVVRKHRPVAVLHFAALAYVGESVEDPARYYRNNVCGTLNLLEAMRRHAIGKLVFSSTCAVYGAPQRVPIAEDHPTAPMNPYGESKLMVEQILRDHAAAFGMRTIALRYFNAAGADPDFEIGEVHRPETHLIPLVLAAAAGLRKRVIVHGSNYNTRDGTCIRDYVHVSDLADAHVLALKSLNRTRGPVELNLGNGAGFSVREIIDAAVRVTGRSIPVREGPRRPGDPPALVGDARRARRALGWQPRLGDIHEIIATAWQWLNVSRAARASMMGIPS